MPTFNSVEVTATADIDFEVYCDCGAGICHNCTTMKTYNRGANRLDVEPCEKCLETARNEGREEMQSRIDELERELAELR